MGCQFFKGSHSSQLTCLNEGLLASGASRVLFVHALFGMGLVPQSFLEKLTAFHESRRAVATFAVNLPSPLAATVLERSFLGPLTEVAAQAKIVDVFTAIKTVVNVSNSDSSSGGGLPIEQVFLLSSSRSPYTNCPALSLGLGRVIWNALDEHSKTA